jgi:hypothetical protein
MRPEDTPTLERTVRHELERMAGEAPRPRPPDTSVRRRVRRRAVSRIGTSALVVALVVSATVVGVRALGRGAPPGPAVGPACSTWSVVPVPAADAAGQDTYLSSVAAAAPDDAVAVGIRREPGEGSRTFLDLLRWGGAGWSATPVPDLPASGEGPTVHAVANAGPSDVWAVGSNQTMRGGIPLALRWDGSGWGASDVPPTGEPESHLFGVGAISPADVWAVGGWARPGELRGGGLAAHWDGSAWRTLVLPVQDHPASETGGPYDTLNAVAGTSPTDVWAVGQAQDVPVSESRTLVMHWDGRSWNRVDSPNVLPEAGGGGVDDTLQAVAALAPDDAWAVGSFEAQGIRLDAPATDRPLALHWDGDGWTVVPLPDVGRGGLTGVAATGTDDVWAVGQTVRTSGGDYAVAPLALHWDGSGWSRVDLPVADDASLTAVAAVPGGGLWAVGNTTPPDSPARGLVLRCS